MAYETVPSPESSGDPFDAEEDFDSFYVRMFNRLVGRAVVLGCSRAAAPELVQDVLIRIWRRWELIHWQTRSRYALTAVHHEVISRYRRNLSAVPERSGLGLDIGPASWNGHADVELRVADKVEAARAYRYIKTTLSPRARHVILMTADGYTSTEIAQELGLDPSAVRRHLHRARTLIKDFLEGRSC